MLLLTIERMIASKLLSEFFEILLRADRQVAYKKAESVWERACELYESGVFPEEGALADAIDMCESELARYEH